MERWGKPLSERLSVNSFLSFIFHPQLAIYRNVYLSVLLRILNRWSYGIVLYEIETLGDVPYPGMDPHTVLQKLKSGYRMEKPENCSTEV